MPKQYGICTGVIGTARAAVLYKQKCGERIIAIPLRPTAHKNRVCGMIGQWNGIHGLESSHYFVSGLFHSIHS